MDNAEWDPHYPQISPHADHRHDNNAPILGQEFYLENPEGFRRDTFHVNTTTRNVWREVNISPSWSERITQFNNNSNISAAAGNNTVETTPPNITVETPPSVLTNPINTPGSSRYSTSSSVSGNNSIPPADVSAFQTQSEFRRGLIRRRLFPNETSSSDSGMVSNNVFIRNLYNNQ